MATGLGSPAGTPGQPDLPLGEHDLLHGCGICLTI